MLYTSNVRQGFERQDGNVDSTQYLADNVIYHILRCRHRHGFVSDIISNSAWLYNGSVYQGSSAVGDVM